MSIYRFTLLLCLALLLLPADAAFRAGIAVRNVTPNPLLPVSGGVGPSHPANRKEGELTVRAMVWEQDTTRVAIVSVDFLGFPAWLGNRVRAAVPELPPQNILIGATHTHSAPDCYGFPDEQGHTSSDPKYLDTVCAQAAEALNEALAKLQPARLKIATGEAHGKIAYNYFPKSSRVNCWTTSSTLTISSRNTRSRSTSQAGRVGSKLSQRRLRHH